MSGAFNWVVLHLILILTAGRNKMLAISSLLLIPLFIIFHISVDTIGDKEGYLEFYANVVNLENEFEIGFWMASKTMMSFFNNEVLLFYFYQLILLILCIFNIKYFIINTKNELHIIVPKFLSIIATVVTLQSAFFFLGSHNVIRQALMIAFAFLASQKFWNRDYIVSFCLLLLSISFHKSAALFILVFFTLRYISVRIGDNTVFIILIGVIFSLVVRWVLLIFFPDSVYFADDFQWAGDRTPSSVKHFIVFSLSLVVQFLLDKSFRKTIINKYRVLYLGFLSPFSMDGEIYARLLIALSFIELIFMCALLYSTKLKCRVAALLLFLSNAFALNVIRLMI